VKDDKIISLIKEVLEENTTDKSKADFIHNLLLFRGEDLSDKLRGKMNRV